MSLMINQNITALNAWRNLNKTDREISGTMEKLSSGLRINKAADDPAGLVISEQMRAQVVGLKAAIKNSEKGVSMIQTAEAALDKIHSLLDKMRALALDSANSATSDANMLAANQAEIHNILETITRISDMTQYGTKKLLNGDNAITGTLAAGTTGATGVSGIAFAPGQSPTSLDVTVAAVPGVNDFAGTNTLAGLNDQGTLALGRYTLSVDGQYETVANDSGTAGTWSGPAAATTGLTYAGTTPQTYTISVTTGVTVGGVTGTDGQLSVTGGGLAAPLTLTVAETDAPGAYAYSITDATAGVTFTLDFGDLSNEAFTGGNTFSVTVDPSTATVTLSNAGGTLGTASFSSGRPAGASVALGGADFDVSGVAFAAGVTNLQDSFDVTSAAGFTAALGGGNGVPVTAGSTATLTDANGNQANLTFGAGLAAGTATIGAFVDNSLVFQIGANQQQTVSIGIPDVAAEQLAIGVAQAHGSGFSSLAEIEIDTAQKATDAIGLIDEAIDQVSVIRGALGAFQANTLEANLDSLRVAAENLQASESVIRDTDMAAEMATFTKYQIMMQAGTAMLAQANQIPQNILQLLQG